MKGIILFGAGASYGTSNVLPKSPPLGSGLYDELAQAYPNTWRTLPDSLVSKFKAYFEDGMDELWQNHSQVVPALMQDMACFFAQYRLDGTQRDYYSRLILYMKEAAKLDDYAFSSINYECILEHSLTLAARNFWYGPDLSNEKDTSTLWKIHGSCNFTVKGISAVKGAVNYLSGATFHGSEIDIIDLTQVSGYCKTSALYPCMSLYAPGKPNQMARAMIESMQKNWQSFVSNAEKVIVIGAAPHPPDNHIWDHIANCQGHLYYIGSEHEFTNWVKSYKRTNAYTYLGRKFAQSYPKLEAIL